LDPSGAAVCIAPNRAHGGAVSTDRCNVKLVTLKLRALGDYLSGGPAPLDAAHADVAEVEDDATRWR
jgi:hypothetical protein